MKKSTCRLTAMTLSLIFALTACGVDRDPPLPSQMPIPSSTPTPVVVEELEFALPCYTEASFHPITGSNRTNLLLMPLMYESLYEITPSFEAVPLLCQSGTPSEDGLNWSFTVKPQAVFSDGSPVTAGDVASSLNQARTSPLYAARLTEVRSITASNGTVMVSLSTPNGALPALLDIPIIKGSGDRPLGTGPYILTGEGDSLSLTTQPSWWQGKALPQESISLRAIQEADDLIYAFDTRDVTMVSTDLTGSSALGYAGGFETIDFSTSVMLYVGFNTKSGICRDATVRRALVRGVDRGGVALGVLARHGVPSGLPLHPSASFFDQPLDSTLTYSPTDLTALLEEAGWRNQDGNLVKNRQSMSLTLLVNQENTYKMNTADFLAQSFKSQGITVEVHKLPWDQYISALEKGEFDLYLGETRLTADFDLTPLLATDGALNYGRYADPETNTLLAAFRAAQGPTRGTAAQALYARVGETAPFAVLCFKNWSLLIQWGRVEGLMPTQQNVFYGFADWKIK